MALKSEQQRTVLGALRRMELISDGERPTLIPLTGGVSSLIVKVETAHGALCVKQALPRLNVAAEWRAPVERNSAEVAWLKLAAVLRPHMVPRILGEDGEARLFAMRYLDSAVYPTWKSQLRDGVIETATAKAVAENLAAVHAATANDANIANRFANDQTFYDLRLEPYLVTAARIHPDCKAALDQLVVTTAGTRRALVHGDVSPKNILSGPHGPVFLDAECACYGDPAFDLAFCLNHLLLKSVWRPAGLSGYMGCFAALARTYLSRVTWEPAAGLEARTARLLPGLLLARIDGKSPVEYITRKADRERVRGIAKRLLLAPRERLGEVSRIWEKEQH
ncbi:MAG TPA: aminoglycoside phosphotransferase family protein [Burkholderiales bacterium]|nr:aminoglycoside phosphotransferase family protein [Burkholderiales bacterium]